ncbi:MAG: hypothetical protein AB7I59_12255 [Geminicoccaceae bacterium]
MSLTWTVALLIVGLSLAALARWQETRPRGAGEVRLFPVLPVMAAGVILSVLAAAHLVSLMTGSPLKGRLGF